MNKNESKYFNTASLMNEALLILLEKKDFEYITVKEICHKAGVSRSTFYLHYESIDDLLKETIENVNKDFISYFVNSSKVDLSKKVLTREEFLLPYLLFVKEHNKIYRLMHEKHYLFGIKPIAVTLYNNIFSHSLTYFNVPENEKKIYFFIFYLRNSFHY
ncbi:MAG: TetR/AcrR family transcriptional regulator [Bacilli bacterium]